MVIRKSVPIDELEQELVEHLQRRPDSLEREVLRREHIMLPEQPSESQVLHALLSLGRRVVRDRALELGYAELAASHHTEDDQHRRELRGQRRMARLESD
jgi:hypothetical protein